MYKKYLFLFYLLDYCYNQDCDNYYLPPFLGQMNPYLLSNHMPIDCAMYEEWYKISKDIKTINELREGTIIFLESYEREGFDFRETKERIRKLSEEEIREIIQTIK